MKTTLSFFVLIISSPFILAGFSWYMIVNAFSLGQYWSEGLAQWVNDNGQE